MKNLFVILLLSVLVMSGCAELKTRQFVVPVPPDQKDADSYVFGEWEILPPSLVAFKNQKDISTINYPHTFWLAFRAEHDVDDNKSLLDSLLIDTVTIELIDESGHIVETFYRVPSRTSIVKNNRGSKYMAIFDFYEDQGVHIPQSIKQVKLRTTFKTDAVSKELFIDMIRDEGEKSIPFSGWR